MQSSAEQSVSIDVNDVKAGDTVTEEVHILDATELQPGDVFVGPDLFDGYIVRRAQPAPEPAPEWRPGQFVSGVVEGARRQGMVDDLGNFLFWNHESEGEQEEPITPGVVTDVRPLVVIDPATVDAESIGAALSEAVREPGAFLAWDEIARLVLAEVGIEVPR